MQTCAQHNYCKSVHSTSTLFLSQTGGMYCSDSTECKITSYNYAQKINSKVD